MKTEWDYTELATAYLKRPDYAPDALDEIFKYADLKSGDKVCDIGAGVAHLTLPLAKFGCIVSAVEPNDAMRALGMERTKHLSNVTWSEGTGEDTRQASNSFDMVTFGSSFNVCDRQAALKESYRLLKSKGSFVCLWNHRDLNDPIQSQIESIIKQEIPSYEYGTRREDQTGVIAESHLFEEAKLIQGTILWKQSIDDTIEAWRSHSTLERQAKEKFGTIVGKIAEFLQSLHKESIEIPYTTHAWIARRID